MERGGAGQGDVFHRGGSTRMRSGCDIGKQQIQEMVTLQSLAKTSKEHDADAHPQRTYPQ